MIQALESEHLTIPAQLSKRPALIAHIARACRRVGPDRPGGGATDELELTDPFDAEFVSAFSEIFNNIVLHGYAGGSDEHIEINIQVRDDELVTRIIEHGEPFDPGDLDAPDLSQLPEGGMGIYIVEAFVDKFDYEPGPPNTWTIKKRYRGQDQAR